MKNNQEEHKKYWFTCDICDNHKQSHVHYGRVNGLGVDPLKTNKICDTCIKWVDVIKDKDNYDW